MTRHLFRYMYIMIPKICSKLKYSQLLGIERFGAFEVAIETKARTVGGAQDLQNQSMN